MRIAFTLVSENTGTLRYFEKMTTKMQPKRALIYIVYYIEILRPNCRYSEYKSILRYETDTLAPIFIDSSAALSKGLSFISGLTGDSMRGNFRTVTSFTDNKVRKNTER
jgi:hypothetical protein